MSTPTGLYSGDPSRPEPPQVVAVLAAPTATATPSLTLRQLRQLTRLLQPLAQEWTVTGRLRRLIDAACQAVGASYVVFGRLGPSGDYSSFLFSPADRQGLAEMRAILTAQGVGAQDDPTRAPVTEGTLESRDDDVQTVSFIVAPLGTGRGRVGNLFVMSTERAPAFTELDRQVILSLVEIAAAGLENIDDYEDSLRSQHWLKAAGEVSQHLIGSNIDELDVWQIIVTNIHRLAAARTVTISMPLTEDPTTINVLVAAGTGAADLVGQRYPVAGSIAEAALSEGRGQVGRPDLYCVHVRVPDDEDGSEQLGDVMAVPLVSSSGTHGAIIVSRRPGDPAFRPIDLSMAQDFASQAVLALERADAHRLQQQLNLLEDRERIARDLHDHVIQSLFATGLNLNSVLQTLSRSTTSPDLLPKISASISSLDTAVHQIRAAIFNLQTGAHPPTSARIVAHQILSDLEPLQLPLAVHLTGTVDNAIAEQTVADLTAVLREALTNAYKHANASHITLAITADDHNLTVDVTDDGTGLQTSQRRSGLANLRSRAARAGGTFTLEPATPHGLHLHWTTPNNAARTTTAAPSSRHTRQQTRRQLVP